MIVVATLYKFVSLPDVCKLRLHLQDLMKLNHIKGTLILATEGINGTVAASSDGIDTLKKFLFSDERFVGMEYKESYADQMPFKRTKIHLKQEIVTLGKPDINPAHHSGTYVNPHEWNDLLIDPAVTVIDVRNDFEVQRGSFKNALNPKTSSFREFVHFAHHNLSPKIHKKIAMSCTGGIRCEKASALLKQMGFSEVFHLKGGVLQYLKDIPKKDSLWHGECFVFDERIAVDHDLKPVAQKDLGLGEQKNSVVS